MTVVLNQRRTKSQATRIWLKSVVNEIFSSLCLNGQAKSFLQVSQQYGVIICFLLGDLVQIDLSLYQHAFNKSNVKGLDLYHPDHVKLYLQWESKGLWSPPLSTKHNLFRCFMATVVS